MNKRTPIYFIFLCGVLHQAIVQGIRPMVPLLAFDLNASAIEIGLIAASFSLIPLFLAFKAGKVIDKFKGSLPISLGLLTISFSLIIPFIWPYLSILYISQTLSGIAHLFIVIAFQNTLSQYVDISKRDHYFGWFSFWVSGGQLIGPLIGGIISESSIYNTFLIFSVTSFVATILCLLLLKQQMNHEDQPQNEKKPTKKAEDNSYSALDLIKIPGMFKSISASMFVQFSKDVIITYFPLFASSHGASTTQIGALISLQGITSMFIRMVQGFILKHVNRFTVLFISLLLSGICYMTLPINDSFIYWTIIFLFLGAGMGLAQPLSTVAVINLSPDNFRGRALSIRITGNRIAQSISPVSFGLVSQSLGLAPIFFICGGILLLGSFYVKSGVKDAE
ncbi:MFS transporter [Alkalibacillus silvisoli]|uniref:MFS transporter n=1 Tax=Alkalibacillus silvisoli TaxID=392823 RepID=UPI0031D86F21